MKGLMLIPLLGILFVLPAQAAMRYTITTEVTKEGETEGFSYITFFSQLGSR